MTYKAGDKVVLIENPNTSVKEIETIQGDKFKWLGQKSDLMFNLSDFRHATPVEIAKQAVLDEVNDRSDSVSPILNELLDVLIDKAKVEAIQGAIEAFRNARAESTPVPEYKTGWPEQKQQTAVVGEKDGIEMVVNNPAYEHSISKETFEQALTNNLSESLTPPIIGDETKLD